MFSISKQISAVTKTTLASPLTVINALSTTAFSGMEKIIALNINVAKQSFESSTSTARALFSIGQPQELFSLNTIKAQPQIETIVAYGRELAEISAQAGKEFLSTLAHSDETISTSVSQTTAKPMIAAPVVKVEKKLLVKIDAPGNTQLALLVEPDVKIAKKIIPKSKAQPIVNKTSIVAAPADIKASKVTPTAHKKIADQKPIELKTIATAPVVKPIGTGVSKPVTKAAVTKTATIKPEIIAPTETVTVTESPAVKKSAVKIPFPASPVKKAAKPAFPTISTRPVYKAKGSAATGAKKPVRQ